MYQPSTEIRIGTVPWNPNYKHVRWYPNLNAQMSGVASFMDARRTISTYTYQRLESAIDVDGNPEQYYNYNYVMFQNENFGAKWFYAFITRAEYKTANTTRLHLELDYVQTYMFDYVIKPCFVEREHVNDDAIGAHVKDEGIDPGELKCTYSAIDNEDMDCYMVVASAVEPLKDGTYVNNGGDKYMGVTSGTSLSVFLTVDDFKGFMKALSDNGQQDAVSQVYMVPRAAIPTIVKFQPALPMRGVTVVQLDEPAAVRYFVHRLHAEHHRRGSARPVFGKRRRGCREHDQLHDQRSARPYEHLRELLESIEDPEHAARRH